MICPSIHRNLLAGLLLSTMMLAGCGGSSGEENIDVTAPEEPVQENPAPEEPIEEEPIEEEPIEEEPIEEEPVQEDPTFQVSATVSGGDATVTPERAEVDEGDFVALEITPATGSRPLDVTGCDGALGDATVNTFTFTTGPITADCAVSITLAELAAPSPDVSAGDRQLTVSWSPVEGASTYDLYYAQESLDDIENYAALEGGTLELDVESPHTIAELENGETYYLRMIALAEPGRSVPSEEEVATPEANELDPARLGALNDTGEDTCATNTEAGLSCPQADFPDQDGDLGRDALARAGELDKVGAGDAGFDYTKIADATGDDLPADAADWSCVRDNVTGLVWERRGDRSYRWYDPEPSRNGGGAGSEEDPLNPDGETTLDRIAEVNEAALCGYTDWRLPTLTELRSIVHRGRTDPAVDTDYFNPFDIAWASTLAALPSQAWAVDFRHGRSSTVSKSNYRPVLLVREGE